ncbi:MAG: hypothetical protein LC795_14275 [Acidobacteria bacterium]|nr:hypothetical protein [Acidobacteriota bacterium]
MRINQNRGGRRTALRGPTTKASVALLAVLLVAAASGAGPGAAGRTADDQTDKARTREWAEKHFPYLVRPDFAKLDLARMVPEHSEGPEKLTAPFKVGGTMNFRLLITNGSDVKVLFPTAGPYEHNRPRLSRGGEPVPYRQDAEKQARLASAQRGYSSVKYYELGPGDTATEAVKLDDWYEPLQAGAYRLTVGRRFILGGEWLDSPSISFEVIP